ncbi:hypothetical protein [Tessaracoccus caeni]|uniref:hypothetical protein n=1 Tax=Tessaracoccus caeni TaxID=3031239 RepID=UPI0023DAA0D1|nr:hypothetical protein [Tessaracoccus caeni]MDF1487083.1 hypothetical protein [Tessaracoccus caeni]
MTGIPFPAPGPVRRSSTGRAVARVIALLSLIGVCIAFVLVAYSSIPDAAGPVHYTGQQISAMLANAVRASAS